MRLFIHGGKGKLIVWHHLCELFRGNGERFLRPIMESSGRCHDGQLIISFTGKQIHKCEAMLSCRSTSFPSLDLKEVMVFCFVEPFVICPDDTFPNWPKRNAFSTWSLCLQTSKPALLGEALFLFTLIQFNQIYGLYLRLLYSGGHHECGWRHKLIQRLPPESLIYIHPPVLGEFSTFWQPNEHIQRKRTWITGNAFTVVLAASNDRMIMCHRSLSDHYIFKKNIEWPTFFFSCVSFTPK